MKPHSLRKELSGSFCEPGEVKLFQFFPSCGSRLNFNLESPIVPTGTASLIFAQAVRPAQYISLLFPPILLGSTYLNILDLKSDSAGITASWSALYLILSQRRQQMLAQKLGWRGLIRGGTQATCMMNVLSCGYVYVSKKGFRLNSPDLPS